MDKSVITTKLRRCPFCGGRAEVVAFDLESVFTGEENDGVPNEGTHYRISHPGEDDILCAVSTFGRGFFGIVGGWIYDSPDGAAAAWNRRAGNG